MNSCIASKLGSLIEPTVLALLYSESDLGSDVGTATSVSIFKELIISKIPKSKTTTFLGFVGTSVSPFEWVIFILFWLAYLAHAH